MPTEEEKALEHLAQENRREAFQRSLQGRLVGSASALKTLKDKWKPVLKSGRWPVD